MKLQRLGPLDTVMLAAERPTAGLHVLGLLILDPSTVPGGYSLEGLRDFIAARLHLVPPLRRRVVEVPLGLARPVWLDEPAVDVTCHVVRADLAAPVGRRALAEFAASIDEAPLDRSRPLWEMHVVEGLEGGRIAVLAKVHHALMDGVAGMEFMAELFSLEPEAQVAGNGSGKSTAEPGRAPGGAEMFVRSVPEWVAWPLRAGQALGKTAGAAIRLGLRGVREHERMASVPAPRVPWTGVVTARRSVAYTSVALADVKYVAHAHDVTVNDVVLGLVAGALRSYLLERDALPERSLVAGVPASTHNAQHDAANAVALMLAELPVEVADPVEQLRRIHASTEAAKDVQDALGPDTMTDWLTVGAPFLFSLVTRLYVDTHLADRIPPIVDVVVSSVPGSPVPLYFAGARVAALHPLGPIYDGMGLNVTAVSNEGDIGFGIVTCPDVVPDVWALADRVPVALAELLR